MINHVWLAEHCLKIDKFQIKNFQKKQYLITKTYEKFF